MNYELKTFFIGLFQGLFFGGACSALQHSGVMFFPVQRKELEQCPTVIVQQNLTLNQTLINVYAYRTDKGI